MDSKIVLEKGSPAYNTLTFAEERLVLDRKFAEKDAPADISTAYHPKLNFLAPRPRFLYYKPKSRPFQLGDDTYSEEKVSICDKSTPSDVGAAYHPKLNFLAPRPRFLYYKPKSRPLEVGDDTYSEEKVGISDVSTPSDIGQDISDDGSGEQPVDTIEKVDGSSLLHHCRMGRRYSRGLSKTLPFLILLCWVSVSLNPMSKIGFSSKDNSCCLSESFLAKTPILNSGKNDGFTNNFTDYYIGGTPEYFYDSVYKQFQISPFALPSLDVGNATDLHSNIDASRIVVSYVYEIQTEMFEEEDAIVIIDNSQPDLVLEFHENEAQIFEAKDVNVITDCNGKQDLNSKCAELGGIHTDGQLDHSNTAETDSIPIDDPPHLNFEVTRHQIDDLLDLKAKLVETVGIHTDREAIMSSQVNEIQVLPELLKLRRSSKLADSLSNFSSLVTQNHIDDMPILNSQVIVVFVYILLHIIAGIYAYFEESCLVNGSAEMSVPVESYPSKLCTFQMGSYENLEKKPKKIYRAKTLSSSNSISGTASYGSFITHEKVSSKHGPGDAAIVAPVRRSWRIKNRVVK